MAAPTFLTDLLQLIRINGHVYTFLMIDEFEEVPAGYLLTKRQKADYMYALMEMLNRTQEGLGLVLAITPEAWDILTQVAPPLQDRLPLVIRLGALGANSIRRLLVGYLSRARRDAGIVVDDPLLPFSDALVSFMADRLPERTARNVLQFAYQLIAYAVANHLDVITQQIADTVLADFTEMKSVDSQKRRAG